MLRFAPLVVLAACAVDTPDVTQTSAASLSFTREHVVDDIYHYQTVLTVGDTPNARVRIHRVVRELAPFVPRHTRGAVMMLHGDFSTFTTNFVPGLAPYLAARDLDVWGVDRRWTLPAKTDDISDFGTMGVAQELDDIRAALAFARAVRTVTGGDGGRVALLGFSHGGQLAYAYAATEAARPPAERHVDALVPIDYYGDYAPEDEDVRALTCEFAQFEYDLVAAGEIDSPNGFIIKLGQLAASDPDGPSPLPLFDGMTNRQAMLLFMGQTYVLAPFAPVYHLAAPILDGDAAVGLREMTEAAANAWLAGATPHQAMLEAADLDRILCAEGPQPVDARLSQIRIPLFYLGAAGGIGSNGVHATTSVASLDVTVQMVQRFTPERRAEDFGHADLLFAADAPALAWQPLASWLLHH